MSKGYIYILINPSLKKDLLKIGRTTRTPEERVKELSNTNLATDYFVAYKAEVADCESAEKDIHKILKDYRFAKNREFFMLPLNEAIMAAMNVASKYNPSKVSVSKTKPEGKQPSILKTQPQGKQHSISPSNRPNDPNDPFKTYNVKPYVTSREGNNAKESNKYFNVGLAKLKSGDQQSALNNMMLAAKLGHTEAEKYANEISQNYGAGHYYHKGIELLQKGEKEEGLKFITRASLNGHREAGNFLFQYKTDTAQKAVKVPIEKTIEKIASIIVFYFLLPLTILVLIIR